MHNVEDGRRAVRLAVQAHMAAQHWNKAELMAAASIDAGTAGDFLNGKRWPQGKTLAKIEDALDWEPGTIARVVAGDPAPAVGATTQDEVSPQGDSLLFQRPPGLSDQQWEAIKQEGLDFIEFQIERSAKQR